MDIKKEGFLQSYQKAFGNITQACEAVGISRQTYYNWIQDNEFKTALDAVEPAEVFLDFTEEKLVKRIMDGDTTAIIFALKTKGKKRGYIERTEVTGADGRPIETKHVVEFRNYADKADRDNSGVQPLIQSGIRN